MKVALVHDWLTGMRGGEKLLERVARRWPDAPIHTLVWKRGAVSEALESHPIRTSFLQRLPELDPRLYATLAASAAPGCATPVPPQPLRAGDADRGREALSHYACRSCHLIPGRSGSAVHVGPSLETVGRRAKIAGVLPNTPENMVRWLRQTQQVKPMTAMPDLGVSAQDAADIAAYLATLR